MGTLSKTSKNLVEKKLFEELSNRSACDVGDNLNEFLSASHDLVKNQIMVESMKKWISEKPLSDDLRSKLCSVTTHSELIYELISDNNLVVEMIDMANSFSQVKKSFNGGIFAKSVMEILNKGFSELRLPYKAYTSGKIISKFKNELLSITDGLKPDVDMVIIDVRTNQVILIASCKTSLFERVMQTVTWKQKLKIKGFELPVVLITQESFSGVNLERVQTLESTFVCDTHMNEYGNIKHFSKIFDFVSSLSK